MTQETPKLHDIDTKIDFKSEIQTISIRQKCFLTHKPTNEKKKIKELQISFNIMKIEYE